MPGGIFTDGPWHQGGKDDVRACSVLGCRPGPRFGVLPILGGLGPTLVGVTHIPHHNSASVSTIARSMKMRTGHRGRDSETVTGSSRPNAAMRPRDSSFLELQRLVGNAAVTELVSRSATGDQARQGRRALDSRLRAASAAVASGGGPTASAQVNGRRLFSDGSGATSTEDKGATTQ